MHFILVYYILGEHNTRKSTERVVVVFVGMIYPPQRRRYNIRKNAP